MKAAAMALITLLTTSAAHAEHCTASIYDRSSGSETASGERLNESALTAAHKTLPLNSHVRVCNLNTGRCATLRISDRGPYIKGRCIDLTPAAAAAIGLTSHAGIAPVEVLPLHKGDWGL